MKWWKMLRASDDVEVQLAAEIEEGVGDDLEPTVRRTPDHPQVGQLGLGDLDRDHVDAGSLELVGEVPVARPEVGARPGGAGRTLRISCQRSCPWVVGMSARSGWHRGW